MLSDAGFVLKSARHCYASPEILQFLGQRGGLGRFAADAEFAKRPTKSLDQTGSTSWRLPSGRRIFSDLLSFSSIART